MDETILCRHCGVPVQATKKAHGEIWRHVVGDEEPYSHCKLFTAQPAPKFWEIERAFMGKMRMAVYETTNLISKALTGVDEDFYRIQLIRTAESVVETFRPKVRETVRVFFANGPYAKQTADVSRATSVFVMRTGERYWLDIKSGNTPTYYLEGTI